MYSPLSQDEDPLLTNTDIRRTLSPNFNNRKLSTIRCVSCLMSHLILSHHTVFLFKELVGVFVPLVDLFTLDVSRAVAKHGPLQLLSVPVTSSLETCPVLCSSGKDRLHEDSQDSQQHSPKHPLPLRPQRWAELCAANKRESLGPAKSPVRAHRPLLQLLVLGCALG